MTIRASPSLIWRITPEPIALPPSAAGPTPRSIKTLARIARCSPGSSSLITDMSGGQLGKVQIGTTVREQHDPQQDDPAGHVDDAQNQPGERQRQPALGSPGSRRARTLPAKRRPIR